MKLLVCGSRDFDNYAEFERLLAEHLASFPAKLIISGGARGADRFAEWYCRDHKIENKIMPADWKGRGRSAGFIRNLEMLAEADMVVAFWDGKSRGTEHTIIQAQRQNKPTRVFFVK